MNGGMDPSFYSCGPHESVHTTVMISNPLNSNDLEAFWWYHLTSTNMFSTI